MNIYLHLILVIGMSAGCFVNGEERKKSFDKQKAYFGNPDLDSKIERPCPVYDLHCIRRFFADHANCTITYGPIPEPLPRSQLSFYFSRVNLTVLQTNLEITNLNNARIEEFYVNKATDKLVIAIEFRNIRISSGNTYFSFNRRGREPIIIEAPTSILYTATFTAVIPHIDDLQLDQAEVTAFTQDAFPPFFIGPQVANSTDPAILTTLAEFMKAIPTNVQEDMSTRGAFYPPTYIQYNICDFGLKVL